MRQSLSCNSIKEGTLKFCKNTSFLISLVNVHHAITLPKTNTVRVKTNIVKTVFRRVRLINVPPHADTNRKDAFRVTEFSHRY